MTQFVVDLFNLCMSPFGMQSNLIVYVPVCAFFFVAVLNIFRVLMGRRW